MAKPPRALAYQKSYIQQQQALATQQSQPVSPQQIQAAQNESQENQELAQKYSSGNLTQTEFRQLFGQQFQQKYGPYSRKALTFAYAKYYQQNNRNPDYQSLQSFQFATSELPKEIKQELGGAGLTPSVGIGRGRQPAPDFTGGFSPIGGGAATANAPNIPTPKNQPVASAVSGGTIYSTPKGFVQSVPASFQKLPPQTPASSQEAIGITPLYENKPKKKEIDFSKYRSIRENNVNDTRSFSNQNDIRKSDSKNYEIKLKEEEPKFRNPFNYQKGVETAAEFIAPKLGKDMQIETHGINPNATTYQTIRAPRVLFPSFGAQGIAEFGISGLITGGFSESLSLGTRKVSQSIGLNETQTNYFDIGTNFGLQLVSFGIAEKGVNSFSKSVVKPRAIDISIKNAKSEQISGLVGGSKQSSFLTGEVSIRTKYDFPFSKIIEEKLPFTKPYFTTRIGGDIEVLSITQNFPNKAPEKILENFAQKTYIESIERNFSSVPDKTFLELGAVGKQAKGDLPSQTQILRRGISKRVEKRDFLSSESESELLVRQVGQLRLRGEVFRSRTFPFQNITRTDTNPNVISFGATNLQSTTSLKDFFSGEFPSNKIRLESIKNGKKEIKLLKNEDRFVLVSEGTQVYPNSFTELIKNEKTSRRGKITSLYETGSLKPVRNPFTNEIVGFNFDEKAILELERPTYSGSYSLKRNLEVENNSFRQTVSKRSFKEGERIGIEFGRAESFQSGRLGGVRFRSSERVNLLGKETFLSKSAREFEERKILKESLSARRRNFGFGDAFPFGERQPITSIVGDTQGAVELLKTEKKVSLPISSPIGGQVVRAILNERSLPGKGFILEKNLSATFSKYSPRQIASFSPIRQERRVSRFDFKSRSFDSYLSANRYRLEGKPVSSNSTKNISKKLSRNVSRNVTRNLTRGLERNLERPATRSLDRIEPRESVRDITIPISRTLERQIMSPVTRTVSRPVQRPLVTNIFRRPSTPVVVSGSRGSFPSKKKNGLFSSAFQVVFKRRGKERLAPGIYTRRDANAIGSQILGRSLRASYKLKPVSGFVEEKNLLGIKLKGYVNKKGFFVQERSTRLNSLGERREIQFAKRFRGIV